jgi:DNA-binding FadR family transcriptional regulator
LRDSVTEALRGDGKAHDYAGHQTLARAIRKGDATAAERAATTLLAAALAAVGSDSRAAGEQP